MLVRLRGNLYIRYPWPPLSDIPCLSDKHVRPRGIDVDKEADCGAEPRVSLIVTMVQAKDKRCVEETVQKHGASLVPFHYFSNQCSGFYAHSFGDVYRIADELSSRGCVGAVGIVNTVWYVKLNRIINLNKLVTYGFMPHSGEFHAVLGYINYVPVKIFYKGTIGIYGALLPDDARKVARKVCYVIMRAGAFL